VHVRGARLGDRGALLPELQQKFSTYLAYALDGQLLEDYPAMSGKPIRFELRTHFAPTQREQQFMDIVTRTILSRRASLFIGSKDERRT